MPRSVSAHRRERQPLKDAGPSTETGRMPHGELRVVLEWLGLVEPDRSRREPIALPRWAPWLVSLLLVSAAALGAIAVSALLGLGG
jgi:hypothetical protein